MPPPKRLPENRKLPSRWVQKHGAYYYVVPSEVRHLWEDKTWFRLGKTLAEAYRTWTHRMELGDAAARVTTIAALLDRYALEVVPTKAPKTASGNLKQIQRIRPVFADMRIEDMEPQHVYQYVARRTAKTAAKREIEVLSHAFTKAVEWGLIKAHPFRGEVRLPGAPPRTRYVEDWEIIEVMTLASRRKKGSVGMIQAYLRLKLLTGLRQRDLLLLTVSACREDGIHVTPSKTKASTGKRLIYEWTPELRQAVDDAMAVRPALSPFLFCNRFGACYVVEETGESKSFNSMWCKFIDRVLRDTKVMERFTEHDLRAKVGSDAESLERARQLLAHADTRMTERVYRRRPERIKPAGSV
jgi:integrase